MQDRFNLTKLYAVRVMMHDGASSLDTCIPFARCVYPSQRWEGIMRRCSCSNCSQTLSSWVGGPLLLWCGGSCLLRWVWVKWWWSTLAPCIIMPHACIIFGFFHIWPFLLSEPIPAQILLRENDNSRCSTAAMCPATLFIVPHSCAGLPILLHYTQGHCQLPEL